MKKTHLSLFSVLFLQGCFGAYLRDSQGLMVYQGPAGILDTVQARRFLLLTDEQIEAVKDLRMQNKDAPSSARRTRDEARSDANFIQSLLEPAQMGLATGRVENHIRRGVDVKIYEMFSSGAKGKLVQTLYVPPKSSTSVTLKAGEKYIFSYLEKPSYVKHEYKFSEPAHPGWLCQYAPL